jgi:dihydroxyacetone kinase phosphotransfer subunit
MTVGIVVVSHSRPLAEAATALATEMLHGREAFVEVAAGLDDGGFGTDAVAISDAVARADHGDGVVVLMDLGSAVLSAELALDLLDDQTRERVVLCPAPLVEGLIVATVAADSGAGAQEVAAEAASALSAKRSHLGATEEMAEPTDAPQAPDGAQIAEYIVSMPHGLHARPSALLVQAVRGLDADVRLRNVTLDTVAVSAGSLSKVATLGALQGHRVEIRATGTQASAAVQSLLELARTGFGEGDGPAQHPSAASRAPATARQERHGHDGSPVPASPGIGIGPVHRLGDAAVVLPPEQPGPPTAQRQRLSVALDEVRADLQTVRARAAREIGETEAAIFDAQLLLLDDPDLIEAVGRQVDTGADAAHAWADGLDAVEARFAAIPDEYMQARAADVRDVRNQVLRALGGSPGGGADVEGVLLADDLTPAVAATLDPARTVAVVLAHGSPTAHSAILLRARGIPAIVGAGALVNAAQAGTLAAVDGTTGEVHLDPDDCVLAEFRSRGDELARRKAAALIRADEPALTRDGTMILIGANLGSAADAQAAVGADLAGLVRTEFCFLDRAQPPTVDEQEAAYRAIAEAMLGRRVTLRTLDVGGDKPLDYLPMPAEANPFLGVRGIRLALASPEFAHRTARSDGASGSRSPGGHHVPDGQHGRRIAGRARAARRRDQSRRTRPTPRAARGHHGRSSRHRAEGRRLRPARGLLVDRHQRSDPVRVSRRARQ